MAKGPLLHWPPEGGKRVCLCVPSQTVEGAIAQDDLPPEPGSELPHPTQPIKTLGTGGSDGCIREETGWDAGSPRCPLMILLCVGFALGSKPGCSLLPATLVRCSRSQQTFPLSVCPMAGFCCLFQKTLMDTSSSSQPHGVSQSLRPAGLRVVHMCSCLVNLKSCSWVWCCNPSILGG